MDIFLFFFFFLSVCHMKILLKQLGSILSFSLSFVFNTLIADFCSSKVFCWQNFPWEVCIVFKCYKVCVGDGHLK